MGPFEFFLLLSFVGGFQPRRLNLRLYRNFGREEGQWIPNEHGTVSNLECISLLQSLNAIMKERGVCV